MQHSRKGFTLFELLIVIFLILMIYSLVFRYMEEKETSSKPLTPLSLKSILKKHTLPDATTTFFCVKKSTVCYLGTGGSFKRYEDPINLEGIESYLLDKDNELILQEYGYYNDDKVSLKINFYPNRSSTKVVLKQGKEVYFIPSFFSSAQQVTSLDEAKELWLKNTQQLSNAGEYY